MGIPGFQLKDSLSFTLPPLPYATNALEPHIDARTMEIHHGKHHQAYVTNLNAAIENTEWANKSIEDILAHVSKLSLAVRNNGGGHYNHSMFWQIMGHGKGGVPTGIIGDAINGTFGSFDAFKEALTKAGMTRFGSGWAWLSKGADGKLFISSTPNQDNPLMDIAEAKGTPILGVDVWEHAYYLNYQNKRADYLAAFFNVIDWDAVAARL
jgi:superoxide dismutase, Fe-Mn family